MCELYSLFQFLLYFMSTRENLNVGSDLISIIFNLFLLCGRVFTGPLFLTNFILLSAVSLHFSYHCQPQLPSLPIHVVLKSSLVLSLWFYYCAYVPHIPFYIFIAMKDEAKYFCISTFQCVLPLLTLLKKYVYDIP